LISILAPCFDLASISLRPRSHVAVIVVVVVDSDVNHHGAVVEEDRDTDLLSHSGGHVVGAKTVKSLNRHGMKSHAIQVAASRSSPSRRHFAA